MFQILFPESPQSVTHVSWTDVSSIQSTLDLVLVFEHFYMHPIVYTE